VFGLMFDIDSWKLKLSEEKIRFTRYGNSKVSLSVLPVSKKNFFLQKLYTYIIDMDFCKQKLNKNESRSKKRERRFKRIAERGGLFGNANRICRELCNRLCQKRTTRLRPVKFSIVNQF